MVIFSNWLGLKGADALLAPSPWLHYWLRPKINLECALKKTAGLLKKCFHLLFQVIITNEIPVTLLEAYIPIPRHIRKGVLIRRIIGSHYVKQLVASNFANKRENFKRELCLKIIIPVSIIACCLAIIWQYSDNCYIPIIFRQYSDKSSYILLFNIQENNYGAPGPTVATALATSTKNDIPVANFVNSW